MGAEAKSSVRELPIACGLSDLEQRKRREELSRQLFSGCQRTDELDDGYEFVFPGGPEWAEKLGEVCGLREGVLPLLRLRDDLRVGARTYLVAGAWPRGNQGFREGGVRRWLVLR